MPASDSPAITTSPSSGRSRPAMRLSSVDLPQPDGPITATNSPWATSRSAPRSARTGAVSFSNVRYAARTSTARPQRLLGDGDRRRSTWTRSLQDSLVDVVVCAGRDKRRPGCPALSPAGVPAVAAPAGRLSRRSTVASLSTVSPGSANCCSRWHRFTASPTSVYSTRSSLPSRAAATVPVLSPMPSPNGASPSASHSSFTACWARCIALGGGQRSFGVVGARHGCPEDRHHRITDVLHHGPTGAEDGTVHLRPVTVELLGEHGRVGVLGDRRVAADVAHQHGHLESLRLADAAPLGEQLVGDAGRQHAAERLALLLALDDGLVQPAQAVERALLARRHRRGELDEQPLDLGLHSAGGRLRRRWRSP